MLSRAGVNGGKDRLAPSRTAQEDMIIDIAVRPLWILLGGELGEKGQLSLFGDPSRLRVM